MTPAHILVLPPGVCPTDAGFISPRTTSAMSDNSSDEAFPDLFTTVPQQPPKWKPGQLNYDQLNQFFQEVGFTLWLVPGS